MKIRKLETFEHGLTRELYETVFFQDEARFVDYYYTCKTQENVIYMAENQDGIQSMLHLNPYTIWWNGAKEKIYYIVAVATRKEYRHQGLMRKLLTKAMQDLYQEKAPFTFLMPAAEAIYTPYGFRRAWEWRWEEDVLAEERKYQSILAEDCSEAQLQNLSDMVNERLQKKFALFSWRSPQYYQRLAKEQSASGGSLEILYERIEGEEKLLCARCRAKETFPPMMTRILHLENFLHRVTCEEPQEFYWNVRDEVIQENNGLFRIKISSAGGECRRISEEWFLKEEICAQEVKIEEIPELLSAADPFQNSFICEVV